MAIPDSTARTMDQIAQPISARDRPGCVSPIWVHILTGDRRRPCADRDAGSRPRALGQHVRLAWRALIVDGIDGPIARKLDVVRLQPNCRARCSTRRRFRHYVFVPAYAITASGLLLPLAAPLLGIGVVVSGALYFADKRMKVSDTSLSRFPRCGSAGASICSCCIAPRGLQPRHRGPDLLTFAPFHTLHPVRRRAAALADAVAAGGVGWAAIYTLACDFNVGVPIVAGLCFIAAYIVGSDAVIRRMKASRHDGITDQRGSVGGVADL